MGMMGSPVFIQWLWLLKERVAASKLCLEKMEKVAFISYIILQHIQSIKLYLLMCLFSGFMI